LSGVGLGDVGLPWQWPADLVLGLIYTLPGETNIN